MSRQTRQPDQWIVVDDGDTPTVCTMGQTYIRRPRQADDPAHTLVPNLREAIRYVDGDAVCFIEDDDWRAPAYCRHVAERLEKYELVGEGRQLYYRVHDRKWMMHENRDHAALTGTAFRSDVLWAFSRLLDMSGGNPWVDAQLWAFAHGYSSNVRFPDWDWLVVGMKGLPGRKGAGLGHEPHAYDMLWISDPSGIKLRSFVGADAGLYAGFYRGAVAA
jgi:glycosyltransferase involved in cell wall biosynthesis